MSWGQVPAQAASSEKTMAAGEWSVLRLAFMGLVYGKANKRLSAVTVAFFCFSSRRRHTGYIGDWSSDVCSSDLADIAHRRQRDAALLGDRKYEVFAIAKQRRIPLAPVRDVGEVMHDRHMHERGFLAEIDHDEIGPLVVPTSPLRFHEADPVPLEPSPKLGQHNAEIYGDWLGMSAAEIVA